jgi:hypothetical protein
MRVQKLRDLGVVEILQNLQHSCNPRDVCERAITAMDRIEAVKDLEANRQTPRDEQMIGPTLSTSP